MKIVSFVFLGLVVWSCSSSLEEEVECSTLQLLVKDKVDPTTCSPANGEIRVVAKGGRTPYSFKANNKVTQTDSLFTLLQGGNYVITVIDAQQCEQSIEVVLTNFNSDLMATSSVTEDTGCLSGTGVVELIPSGGTGPYQARLGTTTLIDNGQPFTFTGVKSGLNQVTIIDSQQCEFVLGVVIPRGKTNTSWSATIKPIIDTHCAKATCHVAGTGRADLSKFDNVKQLAAEIKTRTQNRSMPFDEPLPSDQIQLIACWVDDGAPNN